MTFQSWFGGLMAASSTSESEDSDSDDDYEDASTEVCSSSDGRGRETIISLDNLSIVTLIAGRARMETKVPGVDKCTQTLCKP